MAKFLNFWPFKPRPIVVRQLHYKPGDTVLLHSQIALTREDRANLVKFGDELGVRVRLIDGFGASVEPGASQLAPQAPSVAVGETMQQRSCAISAAPEQGRCPAGPQAEAAMLDPEKSFIVRLCEALGVSTQGLVAFRLSAGEDGTIFPRVRAEYVVGHKLGQAAEKVACEFSLTAVPISTQVVGAVDRSVCLTTLTETIHRLADSQAPHCSEMSSTLPPKGSSPPKG